MSQHSVLVFNVFKYTYLPLSYILLTMGCRKDSFHPVSYIFYRATYLYGFSGIFWGVLSEIGVIPIVHTVRFIHLRRIT